MRSPVSTTHVLQMVPPLSGFAAWCNGYGGTLKVGAVVLGQSDEKPQWHRMFDVIPFVIGCSWGCLDRHFGSAICRDMSNCQYVAQRFSPPVGYAR